MSNGHGGHRTPHNPAPASGPGRLSKRTDGGPGQKLMAPTGMNYGDHKALMDQERTSAMSQVSTPPSINVPSAAPGPAAQGGATPPPFGAPTQRPNEPITAGVDIGPGPGAMPPPPASQPGNGSMTALLQSLAATDTTGVLGQLMQSAAARNA